MIEDVVSTATTGASDNGSALDHGGASDHGNAPRDGGAADGGAVGGGAADGGTAADPLRGRGGITVTKADRQYEDLVSGLNQRYVAAPDSVRLVSTTEEVVAVVQEAVDRGKRLAVRSSGHCYEDFVHNPEVRIILDMSGMHAVGYDPRLNAIAVESGATNLRTYQTLYPEWGVVVPAGFCYSVAMGGHVSGGAWGPLCRLHGLVVDHLYAVEVVVVDAMRPGPRGDRHPRPGRPEPRPLVGPHGRRRRQLRRRHPLLVPFAGRHRAGPARPAAEAARGAPGQRRQLAVGRAEPGRVRPPGPQLRRLARGPPGARRPGAGADQPAGPQPPQRLPDRHARPGGRLGAGRRAAAHAATWSGSARASPWSAAR